MKIRIIETSDVHGYLTNKSTGNAGYGLSHFSSFLKKARNEDKNLIYIDNGDSLQGSEYCNYLSRFKPSAKEIIEAYNYLSPDCRVLGNHDFNYGKAYLNSAIENLTCPTISANILAYDGSPAFKPYIIKNFYDHGKMVRLGILGLTTAHIPHWESGENIKGLKFVSAVEAAKKYVPYLKEKEGCDIIVVSYHGGVERDLESLKILEETDENETFRILDTNLPIDVILTGHQHRAFLKTYKKTLIIQPGSRAEFAADISLDYDFKTKNLKVPSASLIPMKEYLEDPEVLKITKNLDEQVKIRLNQVIGFAPKEYKIEDTFKAQILGHPYFNLINKIALTAFPDGQISASSIFSFDCKGLCEDVKISDVNYNYPFYNTLAKVRVKGYELKKILEKNAEYLVLKNGAIYGNNTKTDFNAYNYDIYYGITYTYDVTRALGDRLIELKFDGKNIRNNDEFNLILPSYRARGGGDFPFFCEDRIAEETEFDLVSLIYSYIKEHSPLKVYNNKNYRIVGFVKIGGPYRA